MEEKNVDEVVNETQLDQDSYDQQESSVTPTSDTEAPKDREVESKQQLNFRRLREEKERLEQEKYDLMQQLQAKQHSIPVDDPDDIADKKYVTQHIKQVQEELALLRLKSQFPDFENVVNAENIREFKAQDPDMAELIHQSKDDYKKAIAVYKQIKRLGIGKSTAYDQDHQRVQVNASKPKPLASVSPQQGDSPLSKANAFANGLTDELRHKLWKEMQQYRNKS